MTNHSESETRPTSPRRRLAVGILVALACCAVAQPPATPLPQPPPRTRRPSPAATPPPVASPVRGDRAPKMQKPPSDSEVLASFGIDTSDAGLLDFLEKGFPATTDLKNLPEKPQDRSQLAVDAMAALAERKSTAAVPLLAAIAQGEIPRGVARLVEMDLARTAPESRQQYEQKAVQVLRYNAVHALGLIGDPRAKPVVLQAFTTEKSVAARVQYSLALASLGDASGLDFLVATINGPTRREAAASARAFFIITGKDFGVSQQTPVRRRKALARQYAEWLQANKAAFRVDPAAVATRRAIPETPTAFEPRTTRDLLKIASNYFDFDNALHSREARARLSGAGKTINKELERLSLDPNEDLDVRMEALNWYYEINRAEAVPVLKKAMRDENPEVVDKARSLLTNVGSDAK